MAFLLPSANLSLSEGASIVTDTLRAARGLIFWNTKQSALKKRLSASNTSGGGIQLRLDRFAANKLKEAGRVDSAGRKSLFGQAFRQSANWGPSALRLSEGSRAWTVRGCA